ncbi:MAG: EamA family transporter [Chloroflexi bacterium]|nr:EamA family transporter [Chloroflexota bacterium]
MNSDLGTAPRRAWIMVALAGVAAAWGISFWYLALGEARVVLVAPLVGVSPLVSIVLTHFFLQRLEKVTMRTVLGALMVVAGAALVTLGNQ